MQSPNQPILYQNADASVTLIDITCSIAAAQVNGITSNTLQLLSCPPLRRPFDTPEPKSDSSKARIAGNTVESGQHAAYHTIIYDALTQIKDNFLDEWCLPRELISESVSWNKEWVENDGQTAQERLDPPKLTAEAEFLTNLRRLPENRLKGNEGYSCSVTPLKRSDARSLKEQVIATEPWQACYSNAEREIVQLSISSPFNDHLTYKFLIPHGARFLMSDCANAASLHAALRLLSDAERPRQFDLISMDPPWPNASAKRKNAYNVHQSLRNVKQLILGMDLDRLVAARGLVGIWITNKPAVRKAVLGPGGVFERLNVGLIEEWIWIKTTSHGEPVTALDGLWRKPYEIFLLARAPATRFDIAVPSQRVRYRVIAGVPDLHSRKPCLKSLLEPLLVNQRDYQALEVFARHLVADWWSWGDEVLRFNWEGYWKRRFDPGLG